MIVDLARTLITTSSEKGRPEFRSLVDELFNILFGSGCGCWILRPDANSSFGHLHVLLSALGELLLTNGVRAKYYWAYIFFDSAAGRAQICDKYGFEGAYNLCLDALGNLFRCAFLTNDGIDGEDLFWDYDCEKEFTDAFTYITLYSSQSGRSTRCIRQILTCLSTAQLNILRKVLLTRLKSTTELSESHRAANIALEWIGKTEMPFSLKHLSRLSIIRTMKDRSMYGASTLELPLDLQSYVLLTLEGSSASFITN